MSVKLQRVSATPILVPRPEFKWEQHAVLNAAVVEEGGKIHLFYRGVYRPQEKVNGMWPQYDSCIGQAVSEDGVNFKRFDKPVLAHGQTLNGILIHDPEDPRITKIEGTYYMTYCNWDTRHCQICLASSTDLKTWKNHGTIVPYERFGMNKNAALFPEKIQGKYAMIHRPEPPQARLHEGKFSWDLWSKNPEYPGGMRLSYSDDLQRWSDEEDCLMGPRPGKWDSLKVGIAGPPIKTDSGWLTVYHGVDQEKTYRLGLALLDLQDPSKVLKRQDEPIIQPETEWEKVGDVANVVFSCGGLIRDGSLWVYYCGADSVLHLAKSTVVDLKEFLTA